MKHNEFVTPNKLFIDSTDVKIAKKVLVDNGIAEDEAETVLQAVGYALLDEELFPENESADTTKTPATKRGFLSHMTELFDIASDFKDIICDVMNDVQNRDGLRSQLREKKRKEYGYSAAQDTTDKNTSDVGCVAEDHKCLHFLVTNTTGFAEYTPSIFSSIKEASDWLKECSIRNFIGGFANGPHPIVFDDRKIGVGNRDEYQYMKANGLIDRFIKEVVNSWEHGDGDCFINNFNSCISYADGTFNNMQVYEVYYEVLRTGKVETRIRAIRDKA